MAQVAENLPHRRPVIHISNTIAADVSATYELSTSIHGINQDLHKNSGFNTI